MSLMIHESRECVQSDTSESCFFLVSGRDEILRMRDVLVAFSAHCLQAGAMDYLEYFLTLSENIKKKPYLVIVTSRPHRNVFQLRAEDLTGAALVYEYKLLGISTSVFSTSDYNGIRTVIAPVASRAKVAAMVCRYLIDEGAQVVLLTFSAAIEAGPIPYVEGTEGRGKFQWTTQSREVGASLVLEDTVSATLAHLGSHTRRNLRYYRRKAEAELACSFAGDVRGTLTRNQLRELNQASTHPVPRAVLERRYATLKMLEGGFCVGVRSASGEWISLMAGRRHHEVTEIDWQINRGGLAKYSIGTVIRAYLIEHEIAVGMKRLFFEGGTPHTLRHSFLSETAIDIVAARPSRRVSLLRRGASLLRLHKNYLLQVLLDPALKWELH
jgi:hypothetical protein